jgi:excisionase family DNA binding protein
VSHTKSIKPLSVNVSEAALLLGVSRPVVYKLIEQGTIRCFQISDRVYRIPLGDIHAAIGLGPDVDTSDNRYSTPASCTAIHDVRGTAQARSAKSNQSNK